MQGRVGLGHAESTIRESASDSDHGFESPDEDRNTKARELHRGEGCGRRGTPGPSHAQARLKRGGAVRQQESPRRTGEQTAEKDGLPR
jgi:hypothetical protein